MEITVYSHHHGMCKDGGQVFKPALDNTVHETIERILAYVSHKQDVRIFASAVSKNGEVHLYNIRIWPHNTLDAKFNFACAKDFCLVEAQVFNSERVRKELQLLLNNLVRHELNTTEETQLFS